MRAEFESVLRFWFDRGVGGFRIDVANGMVKRPDLPDLGPHDEEAVLLPADRPDHPHWDRDGVHDIYRAWRRVADSYPRPPVFVAEAWVRSPERLARYLRPDELHTAFNFDYLRAPWDAAALRKVIDESLATVAAVDAPATWVLSNHDVVPHVSRLGRPLTPGAYSLAHLPPVDTLDRHLGTRRARAAALLMLALPGSAYVYQGVELGLWEVEDLPAEVRQDPTWERSGHTEVGRDGCRVPLPWSGTARRSASARTVPAAPRGCRSPPTSPRSPPRRRTSTRTRCSPCTGPHSRCAASTPPSVTASSPGSRPGRRCWRSPGVAASPAS